MEKLTGDDLICLVIVVGAVVVMVAAILKGYTFGGDD